MDKSLDAISSPLLFLQEKDFGRSKKKSAKELLTKAAREYVEGRVSED
jgi:hypothetical protein